MTSPVDSLFRNRFRLTPEQQPYPVQAAAVQIALGMADPGLMIIEAPMGEGKTEAALAAAEILAATTGAGGCFLALPTRATSDAAFPRMLNWLERVPDADRERGALAVGLAHGKARFHTDFQDLMKVGRSVGIELDGEPQTRELAAHRWLSGRKKALLSSFVVGTIDQLLFAALKSRHLALRHLGLAGKVVIIDEAHAYDVYMSQYLDRALEWLAAYRVPTIVLSATLPGRRRKEMLRRTSGAPARTSGQTPAVLEDRGLRRPHPGATRSVRPRRERTRLSGHHRDHRLRTAVAHGDGTIRPPRGGESGTPGRRPADPGGAATHRTE